MPNILPGLLNQVCVYWPPGSSDKFGAVTPGTAREVACQWEERAETITTADGRILVIHATVFLPSEIVEGGWLYLGRLAGAPAAPPKENRIRQVLTFQDVDANERLWKALL